MEGVPRIPMIGFPLKRSADVPDFKSKIKRFISHHYNEDPESYNQEITNLESLRSAATHPSHDITGCATLKKYFCQLNFLKSRFPFHEGSQIATSFSWYDAYSDSVHGWKDIDFEMACILYNIGALHSELGAKDLRINAEGMKTSCTHFQCAAWAFQHLKNDYHKYFSSDLSADVLSIMTNICLAQAQECILEKSLIDNRKSAITAKVSLQIVEYNQQTLKTIDAVLRKSSAHSEKVLKAVKKWKDLVETKAHYYSCLSYLYRGLHSEEQSRFGERITFFKAGVEKLNDAIKCVKNIDKHEASGVVETLNFTVDVIGTKLSSSEKENEFVYHEKVPELDAVDADFKGVSLVKGIPFKFDDPEISGPDIFSRLVPMEAHEASSLYSEEKAKILRTYSAKVEERNAALDRFLLAMQLDHLDIHADEMSVPQELVDCCASLSVNPEAVKKLSTLMSKLSGMFHDVEHNLKEIDELLKKEEAAEKEFQDIVGKRAPSNVITEITREFKKYQQAHSVASESNQTLHEAMRIHVMNLQILMKPFTELLKSIPSIADAEVKDETAINEMKRLRSKVDEMRSQREMLCNQLRESILNDDITKTLVVKQDQDLENVFREELKKHEKITQLLDQNLSAQEKILRAVTEANAAYAATRRATEEVMKKRNQVIQDLLSSYDAYNELLIKCTQGVEFYTKLDTNVSKLLQRVRSTCKVLEEEREERTSIILKKASLPPAIPDNNISSSAGTAPQLYASYSSNTSKESYHTPLQPQSEGPLSVASHYGNNVDLQKQYELQQQYEKNLALQKEMEELARLQQQIASAKQSPIPAGNYNARYNASYTSPAGLAQSYSGVAQVTSAYPSAVTSTYYNSAGIPTAAQQQLPSSSVNYMPTSSVVNPYISTSSNSNSYGVVPAVTQPSVAISLQSQGPYYANHTANTYSQPYYPSSSMSRGVTTVSAGSTVTTQIPPSSGMTSAIAQSNQPVSTNSMAGIVQPGQSASASPVPGVVQPAQPLSLNTTGVTEYSGYSHNPLLQQYSQQYGHVMNPPAAQEYGSYHPILGQHYSSNPQSSYASLSTTSQYQQGYPTSYQHPGSQDSQGYSAGSLSANQYGGVNQQQPPTYSFSKLSDSSSYYSESTYTPAGVVTGNMTYSYASPATLSSEAAGSYAYPATNYYSQGSGTMTTPAYQNNYYQQPVPGSQQSVNNVSLQSNYGGQADVYHQMPATQASDVNPSSAVGGVSVPIPGTAGGGVPPQTRGAPAAGVSPHATGTAAVLRSTTGLSNIDLLADVDLSLPDPPLQPVPSSRQEHPATVASYVNNQQGLNSPALTNGTSGDGKATDRDSAVSNDSLQASGENPPKGHPLDVLNLKKPSVADKGKAAVDHLSDPSVLEKFIKDVENLEHTFEGFYKKSLNGPTNLDIKWKEVMDKQNAASIKMDISVARCYPMKNRYSDILPYDQMRVPLPCTKDDYINASFVREISPSSVPIIATQAPLPVTFSDFWHMVWFHQIELIACLTNDTEMKDHVYWPLERGNDLQFGPLIVSLHAKNMKPAYVERIFGITNRESKQTRVTVHLQFKGWTGNVFPDNPAPLLQFVNEVHSFFLQQRSLSRPVIVHCLSGVGKTGVFVILSAAIREITSGASFPDLISLAGLASEQRKGIMNDKEYLRFAHQCLLYYCQDLLMKRGILSGRNQSKFEEKKKSSHSRHPSQDFLTEAVKNIVKTESQSSLGVEPTEKEHNTSSNSMPCSPVYRKRNSSEGRRDAVPAGGATFSDIPASLLDVDASTFHSANRTDNVAESKLTSFDVRKGTLSKKPEIVTDPLDALDPLWTMKK